MTPETKRTAWGASVVGLVLLGSGFALGRGCARPAVEERTRVQVVEKQVVVTQERVRVERVVEKQLVQALHRETRETKAPDGTLAKVTTEDLVTRSAEQEHQQQAAERASSAASSSSSDAFKHLVPTATHWEVDALVGTSVLAWPPVLAYGGAVRYRVGPVGFGAFGLSSGVVGVSAGLRF